ncbi:hypothetical protein D3C78_1233930 [compost metagenome]
MVHTLLILIRTKGYSWSNFCQFVIDVRRTIIRGNDEIRLKCHDRLKVRLLTSSYICYAIRQTRGCIYPFLIAFYICNSNRVYSKRYQIFSISKLQSNDSLRCSFNFCSSQSMLNGMCCFSCCICCILILRVLRICSTAAVRAFLSTVRAISIPACC